jgi:hypothetical protein
MRMAFLFLPQNMTDDELEVELVRIKLLGYSYRITYFPNSPYYKVEGDRDYDITWWPSDRPNNLLYQRVIACASPRDAKIKMINVIDNND